MFSRFCRHKKGQFLVLMSIGIVVVMVTLSYLLSYTAVSPAHFSKPDFRGDVTELDVNFRRALTIALADVTKELEFKASKTNYMNYTKLEEYPDAEKRGLEFMAEWLNTTSDNYRGQAISLSLSRPDFQCDWSTSLGYSICSGNMSLDIGSESFHGWKNRRTAELSATIEGLEELDGNRTSFYFNAKQELDRPVTGLTMSLVKVLLREQTGTFRETGVIRLTYMGEGSYLVEYYTGMLRIDDEIDSLREAIWDLTPDAFLPADNPDLRASRHEELYHRMWTVDDIYRQGNLTDAHEYLQEGVYRYLDLNDTLN